MRVRVVKSGRYYFPQYQKRFLLFFKVWRYFLVAKENDPHPDETTKMRVFFESEGNAISYAKTKKMNSVFDRLLEKEKNDGVIWTDEEI